MGQAVWWDLRNAFWCWVGLHHIPQKSAVTTMGAVFRGGMCLRCFRVKVRAFLCNMWDDAQTEVVNGAYHLKGTNPIIIQGSYFVMDLDGLEAVAEYKRAERSGKNIENDSTF